MNICKGFIPVIQENLNEILSLRNTKRLKLDQSYVSEGDLLCESLVFEYFGKISDKVIIISEESCAKNHIELDADTYIVTVDPIDGTENFVSGLKEWGIGISIYKGSEHLESMIALPEFNQYLISGNEFQKFDSRIYGISSSLTKEDLLNLEPGFEYRIIGCAMYNMFNVIHGSYKKFQNPKGAYSWDILPGLNLALEHNLEVKVNNKEYHGEFLQPNIRYRFSITNI